MQLLQFSRQKKLSPNDDHHHGHRENGFDGDLDDNDDDDDDVPGQRPTDMPLKMMMIQIYAESLV